MFGEAYFGNLSELFLFLFFHSRCYVLSSSEYFRRIFV